MGTVTDESLRAAIVADLIARGACPACLGELEHSPDCPRPEIPLPAR